MQQQAAAPALGADVSPLALRVENVDSRTLRVRIGAEGRWEVPRALLLGTTESAPAPARSLSHVQAQTDVQVLCGARFEQPAAWPWPAACQRARLARAPSALPTPPLGTLSLVSSSERRRMVRLRMLRGVVM